MPLTNEAVETLTSAGLTFLQAKVYFALIKAGKADTKMLSKTADLDRSNTYKTIEALQNIGLVEKILGFPHSYVGVTLEEAFEILLDKKAKDYAASKRKSKMLIKKFATIYQQSPEEEYFNVLPGKEAFIKKWEKTLKTVEHNLDLIVTEKREPKDSPIWEIYEKIVLPKGVKVRWILDRSGRDDREFSLRVKEFEHLFVFPNLQMKISFESLKPYGICCEDKFVVYFLDPTSQVKNSRTLWTNNPAMISAFQEHFEVKWSAAEEYKPLIHQELLSAW